MSFFPNKFLTNVLACGLFLSYPCHLAIASQIEGGQLSKVAATATQPATKWQQYVQSSSGFSVDLPKRPEHVQQSIDIPKTDLKIQYETYLSEPSENVVYVISVWNYPAEIDMSKPEANLQDGFKGMLSALPGSEVLNMKMGDVQGFKSLEFLVKSEDIYFQGKLILVYNTLYQVFTVYKDSVDMTDNYAHFINSFSLINPGSHKVAPPSSGGTFNGNSKKSKMNV